jgi:putative membrane fusion protein
MGTKQKEKASKRIKLGSLLVMFFLLLYIPSVIMWAYGNNVSTDIVRMGEIEDSINTDAYIIRDEEVLNSPIDGKCIKSVLDGEKIRKDTTVATILNKSSEELLADMKALDLSIIEMQKKEMDNRNFFSEDIKKIDKEIEEKLQTVILKSNTGNLLEVRGIKDEIDELIQKKATIAGDLSISNVRLKSLKNEKMILQQRINENTKKIVSITSGIVSYIVDGYEDVLNPDKISSLTVAELEKLKVVRKNSDKDNISVKADKPVAKIVKGIDYYIVFALDSRQSEDIEEGRGFDIRINDMDKVIRGKVFFKSEPMEGKYIIAIEVDKALSETVGLRKISVDLIKSYYNGLKVPVHSLRNIDEKNKIADIFLVKANRAKNAKVQIVGINNEFAIISDPGIKFNDGVSLYSSYIVNSKNVEEGQIIN